MSEFGDNKRVSLEKEPLNEEHSVPHALNEMKKGQNDGNRAKTILIVISLTALMVLSLMAFLAGKVVTGIKDFFAEPVETVSTPDGEVEIEEGVEGEFYDALFKNDPAGLDALLTDHPYMIYYKNGGIGSMIDRTAKECSVELVQTALDHGAKFDDPFMLEDNTCKYSMESFFRYVSDRTVKISPNRDVNGIIGGMIENGAAVEFEYPEEERILGGENDVIKVRDHSPNALFYAAEWVCRDKVFDEKDAELIKMLVDAGASTDEKDTEGHTAKECFEDDALWHKAEQNKYYDEINELLK